MRTVKTIIQTTIVLILVIIGGALAYAYSGLYDVAVGSGHSPVTGWFLETVRHRSVERRAGHIDVPDLSDEQMIRDGMVAYDNACAGCHGHPGREPSSSFDPRPPALTRGRPNPAQTFWVIENGIKMSAMPTMGERFSDDETWSIVAFLQEAKGLSEGEYRRRLEQATAEPEPQTVPEEQEQAATDPEANADTDLDVVDDDDRSDDAPQEERGTGHDDNAQDEDGGHDPEP